MPSWLHALSWASTGFGILCSLWILRDVIRRPQKMAVMNVVWPVTALFGSALAVWAYRTWGHRDPQSTPFAIKVLKGAAHCGSGCTLGDIAGESLALAAPGILAIAGLGSIFTNETFARWVVDFVFAFTAGIVFQYFAIVPMRHLGIAQGLWAALKADTLSLCAWQVGMYGAMAVLGFWLFPAAFGERLAPSMVEFWFSMQFAMLCGMATAYPVNWWLIRKGWKEAM